MAKSNLVKANEKIADRFVDNFLTKDGESVEEAKARLSVEQKEREAKSAAERGEREQKQKAAVEANIQKTENAAAEAGRKAGPEQ